MEIINTAFSVRTKGCEWLEEKDKKQRVWKTQPKSERENEIINTIFLKWSRNKSRILRGATHPYHGGRGGHAVCVCMWSDWCIGTLNCRCVELLPSLLPSVTNKENGFYAHTHTQTHACNPL